MRKVLKKLDQAINNRVEMYRSNEPTKSPNDAVRDAWNLYVGYCSWEDLPPKMSAKIKEAAEALNNCVIISKEEYRLFKETADTITKL